MIWCSKITLEVFRANYQGLSLYKEYISIFKFRRVSTLDVYFHNHNKIRKTKAYSKSETLISKFFCVDIWQDMNQFYDVNDLIFRTCRYHCRHNYLLAKAIHILPYIMFVSKILFSYVSNMIWVQTFFNGNA